VIPFPGPASFDQVTDLVWIGSRIVSLADYRRVRAAGVRACVDMKQEGADPWSFEAFLWLPTPDHEPPSQAHLRMGLSFLQECERAAMTVLVSCHAGVGRSTTLVLAHLLARSFRQRASQPTLDVRAALELIVSRRPVVRPTADQIEAARLAAASLEASGPA
jgi:hypothetical protein